MATKSTDRASYFPAIEKKHGLPMSHWFGVMEEIGGRKYQEQIDFLRENHGFSQAHANALVMYTRGSTSSRRFDSVDAYLEPFDEAKRATVRRILRAAAKGHADAETVIAWNKPMVRIEGQYVLGVAVADKHILLLPFASDAIARMGPRLDAYETNKKTIKVPVDWKVDASLIEELVDARLAES